MVGQVALSVTRDDFVGPYWRMQVKETAVEGLAHFNRNLRGSGIFYVNEMGRQTTYGCPLWYPALVFALAGVGVLRFRRQFSIRSALVCWTVAAALLGMAMAL